MGIWLLISVAVTLVTEASFKRAYRARLKAREDFDRGYTDPDTAMRNLERAQRGAKVWTIVSFASLFATIGLGVAWLFS